MFVGSCTLLYKRFLKFLKNYFYHCKLLHQTFYFFIKNFYYICMELNKENMRIPKKFKLFATTINVVFDNEKMNDKQLYGQADYSKSQIILSTTIGLDNLSEDKIMDTFYHEKVHHILDGMSSELCQNEEFVDVFAKLLRQSDETAEY